MARFVYQVFAEQRMSPTVESSDVPVFRFSNLDSFEYIRDRSDND